VIFFIGLLVPTEGGGGRDGYEGDQGEVKKKNESGR